VKQPTIQKFDYPRVDTIGPQNPLDVAMGCAASGAPRLALDLSPIGILPDLAGAAMSGSINPVLNSGDKLNDTGNAVDLAGKAADALKKTLPFLGPVAKKLGPVGATISVVKAGRDFSTVTDKKKLQAPTSAWEQVITVALFAVAVGAPDKWLTAIFVTVVTFGGMISFFKGRWPSRKFWEIITGAFVIHLVLAWLVFGVALRKMTDVGLLVAFQASS